MAQTMTQTQSAYHLLVLLSVVDGYQDNEEIDSIKNYLEKNFDGSFNILEENQKLEQMQDEDLPDHFQEVANQFMNTSTDLDRFEFLLFALQLVMADGEITADERVSFASLAELWGVELESFLRTATYLVKGPHTDLTDTSNQNNNH